MTSVSIGKLQEWVTKFGDICPWGKLLLLAYIKRFLPNDLICRQIHPNTMTWRQDLEYIFLKYRHTLLKIIQSI